MASKGVLKTINAEFLIILIIAFLFSYVPVISAPFTWVMTFFHEISHGIGALITGGSVIKIKLHLKGSGLCTTSGGFRFVVLQAGYIGAVVWGCMIYKMACVKRKKTANGLAIFLAFLVLVSALLLGRDIITWFILAVLFALFVSVVKLKDENLMQFVLKFIGLYVSLDAVRAPLYLIDGRHYGDGAALADLTKLPEIIWIIIWFIIGLFGIYYSWKINKKY